MTLNADQFGEQGELWPRAEIDALDTAARRNTAERGVDSDEGALRLPRHKVRVYGEHRERYLDHMAASKATRADLHEIEHIGPSVRFSYPDSSYLLGAVGDYSARSHLIKVGPRPDHPVEEGQTLYHELGHAVHINRQVGLTEELRDVEQTERGGFQNQSPRLEGVADGYADRLSGGERLQSYRDSMAYRQWRPQGERAYEKARFDTKRGKMPALSDQVGQMRDAVKEPAPQGRLFPANTGYSGLRQKTLKDMPGSDGKGAIKDQK
jgi:hypothetical protein